MSSYQVTPVTFNYGSVQGAMGGSYQQVHFLGQGLLPANTYTFTTAGPRYKVSMGTSPSNIYAIGSSLQNTTGAFAPCGTRDDRYNPRCY